MFIMIPLRHDKNNDDVGFVLDQHAMLDVYYARSLKPQSNDKMLSWFRANRSLLSWFQANRSLLLILNGACLAVKQQHMPVL